ncbi:MAG TPA: hypothetical protein VK928_01495, partial [Longimicrobiales bacterium]|nr:hypothetical protein [Longimicrobiales bacterium]
MKTRWKWVGAGVVTVVVAALGYMQYKGFRPAEVAELLAEEGERVLREPLRPTRGAPRVLVFALDGVG